MIGDDGIQPMERPSQRDLKHAERMAMTSLPATDAS
jgi:hypothetical protein